MKEIARLRELLAAATPGPWEAPAALVGDDFVIFDAAEPDAALIASAVNALPSLLDRLEAAEVVVEAAGEVNNAAVLMCHATDGDPGCMAERVSLDAAADALRAALRRYTEVPRG